MAKKISIRNHLKYINILLLLNGITARGRTKNNLPLYEKKKKNSKNKKTCRHDREWQNQRVFFWPWQLFLVDGTPFVFP